MKKSRILLIVMVVGSHLYGSSLKNHRYNDQNQILSFDDAAYGVIFNGNGEPIRYEDGAELQYDDKNNVIIYNQENFDLKISSAINWSLKYKFDLQEDLNYTKFIKNNYYEIYEKIKNFNDKETVILKFNKLNNKNISFDEHFNYIKKINLINNYIINNIDTRDIRIYR